MRNWIVLGIAAVLALAACGPSGKQVGFAKAARYQGDKLALFAAMKTTVESHYRLHQSDETTLGLQTVARWYSPEGLVASAQGSENVKNLPDNSLSVSLVVRLLADGDNWIVNIEPVMLRYRAGRPNPDRIVPTDPSVPGWATSKVDQLYFDINKALKQWELKTVGGVAPAPEPKPEQPPGPMPGNDPAPPAADPAPQPQ
ncbi:MAG: hypothetical protein KF773_30430 [Deltaproteobacteria bacterium]|nr:hypothetical protein [Deltaproteobacteria bacterium]MCW5805077.1 hypothetical protein [Deltaproteobacteria bacterium]